MLEWDNFGGTIMYYRAQPLSEDEIELMGLFGMRTWRGKSKMYEGKQSDEFSIEELADRLLKQRRKQTPKFNVRPTWAIIRVYQMIKDNLGKKIEPKESRAHHFKLEEVKCPETGDNKYHLVPYFSPDYSGA